MNKNWPTKEKDVEIARAIIDDYIDEHGDNKIGLFEVLVDNGKLKSLVVSPWVEKVKDYFIELYGEQQGELITKKVISFCLVQAKSVH